MRRPRVKSVVLVAAAAFVGYVAGINRGYTEGFGRATNGQSADASIMAVALSSLDSENSAQARALLEVHLDSLLIDNTTGRSTSPWVLHRWIFAGQQDSIDTLAAQGARYRIENPHRGEGDELRAIVEEAAHTILEREPDSAGVRRGGE